jgi:hypothetical protein
MGLKASDDKKGGFWQFVDCLHPPAANYGFLPSIPVSS